MTLQAEALMRNEPYRLAEILLPNHLDQSFSYAVPEAMALEVGDLVKVSFGSRELVGVVWEAMVQAEAISPKTKTILEKLEHVPPMPATLREFVSFVASYTLSPVGAVLKMALPVKLDMPKRRGNSSLSKWVASQDSDSPRPLPNHIGEGMAKLEPEQIRAAEALKEKLQHGFNVTLLDGVTGSGKTEVYFKAVENAIAQGEQALILLPEIALSVQWLERFEKRFGFMPEVWHSGVSPAKKRKTFLKLARGEAPVVVGARSALFLTFASLGVMVVDEEHDASYKQEDGVIYHARDMAVVRAKMEAVPIVLASATPSLETWLNAKQGRYHLIQLHKRFSDAQMPHSKLIDLRRESLERGAFLSAPLKLAMAEALARGEQSLLFLNRRGYAPLMLCRKCGHRFACPHCSAWMVLHKGARKLCCHHCGREEALPEICPECKAEESLHACGPGVERIVEEVKQFLPEAKVASVSSDGDVEQSLADTIRAMQAGDIDVLVGTQMVAKGHHFPNLTLVGVVDADLGLAGGDLRAMERTYQLLHQIAGRAGREAKEGAALVQTFSPEHPALQALVSGDRERFMEQESISRKLGHMPPYARLMAVIVEAKREEDVAEAARNLARHFPTHDKARLYGPSPAPLYRLRTWFRWRLLVVAERDLSLQSLAREWQSRVKLSHHIKCKFDIDPYGFL